MFRQMRTMAVAGMVCLALSVCFCWTPVQAENRVRVESVTTYPGNTVDAGIYITNDVELQNFVVPLVVRTLTGGAFWTAVDTLPWSTRGDPGGGPTHFWSTVQVDFTSPDKIKVAWLKGIFGPGLPPGTDEPDNPTVRLRITVNDSVGEIEIDTTVCPPACTLGFTDMGGLSVPVQFTTGVVTIEACDCPDQGNVETSAPSVNIFDIIKMIDHVFRSGPPLIQDPDCPANRGEWYCDGAVDVVDVVQMIGWWAGSREGGPCDPCACSPYPTSCPPPQ